MSGVDKSGGFWVGTVIFLVIEAAFMAFVKFTNQKAPTTETMCVIESSAHISSLYIDHLAWKRGMS